MENGVHFYIKRLKHLCMLYYEEEIIGTLLLSSANSTVTGNNASSEAGKSTQFWGGVGCFRDGRRVVLSCPLELILKM